MDNVRKCPHCGKNILTEIQKIILAAIIKCKGKSMNDICVEVSKKYSMTSALMCYHVRPLKNAGLIQHNPKTGRLEIGK